MIAYVKKNLTKTKVDQKLKHQIQGKKNRKRKQHHCELYTNTQTQGHSNSSTERVSKQREKKKLITANLPFTPKSTMKVWKAIKVIKNSLPGTPKSNARTPHQCHQFTFSPRH